MTIRDLHQILFLAGRFPTLKSSSASLSENLRRHVNPSLEHVKSYEMTVISLGEQDDISRGTRCNEMGLECKGF